MQRENLTNEQIAIIEAASDIDDSGLLVVDAYAGSGKTFTTLQIMQEIAQKHPTAHIAYFVFNNFMKKEIDYKAQRLGISNTSFFTYHSFMLQQAMKNEEIKNYFVDENGEYKIDFQKKGYSIKDVSEVVKQWGVSGSWELDKALYYGLKEWLTSSIATKPFIIQTAQEVFGGKVQGIEIEALKDELFSFKKEIVKGFKNLQSVNLEKLEHDALYKLALAKLYKYVYAKLRYTHEGYYKRVYEIALQKGIDLFADFHLLIVDEAQDIDPIFASLLHNVDKKIILLGDPHQSIYAFRGSVNMLEKMHEKANEALKLSQSFRYGDDLAKYFNIVLSKKGVAAEIKGKYVHSLISFWDTPLKKEDLAQRIIEFVQNGSRKVATDKKRERQKALAKNKIAFIARYNKSLIKALYATFKAIQQNDDIREDCFVATTETVAEELKKIQSLDFGSKIKRSVEMASGQEYAQAVKGMELKDFVEKYGYLLADDKRYNFLLEEDAYRDFASVMEQLASRKKHSIAKNDKNANIVFTTAHGAKGKEYNEVIVCDDFDLEKDEETNIAYVAVSRAKKRLYFYNEENCLYKLYQEHKEAIKNEIERNSRLYFKNGVEVDIGYDGEKSFYKYDIYRYGSIAFTIYLAKPALQIYYVQNELINDDGILLIGEDEKISYSFIDTNEIDKNKLSSYKRYIGTSVKRAGKEQRESIDVF